MAKFIRKKNRTILNTHALTPLARVLKTKPTTTNLNEIVVIKNYDVPLMLYTDALSRITDADGKK